MKARGRTDADEDKPSTGGMTRKMMTIETDGWSTTMSLTVRHLQVVTSHDIEHSLLESVTCHKTAQTFKFAAMQVCCAMANPTVCDSEGVKSIGRYLGGRPRAKCWFRWQQSGELEAYSDADWEATRPLGDQSQAGSS